MPKTALVISGGGARGAWGVGVAKALTQNRGKDFSSVVGTSTGSLMGPLILANEFTRLEEAYTSVDQNSIFNVNPFNNNGGIKVLNAVFRLIGNKKSLGETDNLKKLIKEFFTVELYNKLRNSDKTFGATVTSLNTSKSKVETLKTNSYNDIVDWIWASSNQPVFMSLLSKDGEVWVDGGIRDYLPIQYVLDNDLGDEIDVIIHNPPEITNTNWKPDGDALSVLLRTIDILITDVTQNDIVVANLNNQLGRNIDINFYFMTNNQFDLIPNSLLFDKIKMKKLLKEGYDSIINNTCIVDQCMITKDGKIVTRHNIP